MLDIRRNVIENGYLLVQPPYRKSGFGREMMSAVEHMLRDIGFKEVVFDSVVPKSTGFWRKLGYRYSAKTGECTKTL